MWRTPTARNEQPMDLNEPVKKNLSFYESDNPGTKANLARILLQGKLGGTGRLLILPVDQGVEHGPARSFAPNSPAYDPHYHYQLAIEAGLSAYAAPLGFLEAGADGGAKDLDGGFAEVRAVRDGGGNGSIIGRNTFQRPKKEAIDMLSKIVKIYQG